MADYKTWTMQQFAAFLQISTRTLKRRIAKKEVPAPRKIGPMKRFDHQEIMEWWERKGEESKIIYRPIVPMPGSRHEDDMHLVRQQYGRETAVR
jgi:excisionase family DNA binding protein